MVVAVVGCFVTASGTTLRKWREVWKSLLTVVGLNMKQKDDDDDGVIIKQKSYLERMPTVPLKSAGRMTLWIDQQQGGAPPGKHSGGLEVEYS